MFGVNWFDQNHVIVTSLAYTQDKYTENTTLHIQQEHIQNVEKELEAKGKKETNIMIINRG